MTAKGDLYLTADRPGQVEWKIKGFFDLPKTGPLRLESPRFKLSKATWFLRFYPNGEEMKNSNWMVMYLVKEPSEDLSVYYSFGVKTFDGSVCKSFSGVNLFDTLYKTWGIKLIKKSEFQSLKNIVGPDETLWIYCCIEKLDGYFYTDHCLTNYPSFRLRKFKTEETELRQKLSVTIKEEHDYKRQETELKEKLAVMNKERDDCKRKLTELKEKLAKANKSKKVGAVNIKNTEQDVKQGATKLPQNLRELAPDRTECDLKITFSDKEYMVHRSVLCSKSEFFRKMLMKQDGTRNSKNTLYVKEGDPILFEDFILYMYTGKLDHVSLNNVIALYRTADHYKVPDLKMACARSLACKMSTEFMNDVQKTIFSCDLPKISKSGTDFLISDNE